MKYLWISLFMLMSACTVTQPYIVEYKISPKISNEKSSAKMCKEKSLKVAQVFGSSSLMSHSMKYSKNKYEEHSFTESKWATTPAVAINESIVQSIRSKNIFSNVSSFKSRSRSDFILESDVDEFMQYFSDENNSSFVKVSITMSLIDAKNKKVLKSKMFTEEMNVVNLNAKSGVEELNIALQTVLEQSNEWLEDICK